MRLCHRTIVWIVSAVATLAGGPAQAELPSVRFDLPDIIWVHDLTSEAFRQVNPHQKLVELVIPVSALLAQGDEADLAEYFITIDCTSTHAQVVDYFPKTYVGSDIVGPVTTEKQEEATAGLNAGATFDQLGFAKGTTAATLGIKNGSKVRYDSLPPTEIVAASGTLKRGRSLYFKLRPSRTRSLQGAHDLIVVLRVPAAWRADYVEVHCRALGIRRGLLRSLDTEHPCGGGDYLVGIFMEGDRAAQIAVEGLLAEHREVSQLLRQQREQRNEAGATLSIGPFSLPPWPGESKEPKAIPREMVSAMRRLRSAQSEVHAMAASDQTAAEAASLSQRSVESDPVRSTVQN